VSFDARLAKDNADDAAPAARQGKHKLILVTIGVLKWPILLPVIPKLALIRFTFCQPFLVNRFLNYLQDPAEDSTPNVGYALIGAYGLVYSGMAVGAFIMSRNELYLEANITRFPTAFMHIVR
jgi:hypothetical protein